MKKTLILAAAIMIGSLACSANERPIDPAKLPQAAKTLIAEHFSDWKILTATVENDGAEKEYKVFFANGGQIEFDRKGNWKDIECLSGIPESVVPAKINTFIKENYPDSRIVDLQRDRRDYEVKLDNRIELKFDTAFNFLGFD